MGFQNHTVMDNVVFSLVEYSCIWCSFLNIACGFSFRERDGGFIILVDVYVVSCCALV